MDSDEGGEYDDDDDLDHYEPLGTDDDISDEDTSELFKICRQSAFS